MIWEHGCAQEVETNPWVPAMVADVDRITGDELRGGEGILVDLGSWAMVALGRG